MSSEQLLLTHYAEAAAAPELDCISGIRMRSNDSSRDGRS